MNTRESEVQEDTDEYITLQLANGGGVLVRAVAMPVDEPEEVPERPLLPDIIEDL